MVTIQPQLGSPLRMTTPRLCQRYATPTIPDTTHHQVKQERARAEEAMHKQARRKNRVYSRYNDDGGGAGRRSAMNIDYLEVRVE